MQIVPTAVLALMLVINLVRGCIHTFASDGGAHSIAGLDVSQAPQTILSLFALMGIHQLVVAGFQFYVLIWRPKLVLLALVLQTAETLFAVLNLWFYRRMPVAVPGARFNAALLAILLIAIVIAMRSTAAI